MQIPDIGKLINYDKSYVDEFVAETYYINEFNTPKTYVLNYMMDGDEIKNLYIREISYMMHKDIKIIQTYEFKNKEVILSESKII